MGITVGTGEQIVDWPATRLPVGTLKHVVLTIDGNNQIGRLYVDGVPAGQNLSLTLNPASLGFTVNNWIGRSQFSNDPFLNASITEFRIYDDVLTPTQVQQSFNYGPEVAGLEGPVSVITHPQSKTVTELLPVSFEVQYGGTPPVSLQWLRNGQPIANATNTTYTIAAVALTNHSEIYRVALTNEYNFATYTALSSNAVLTVTADTTAPALVRADSFFPNEVRVTFSEGVRADTATNAANYVITRVGGSLGISGARVGNNASEIILTTAAQTIGTEYTVTVNGVRDLALAANLIAGGETLDHQWLQPGTGGVHRRGEPGGSGTDDHDLFVLWSHLPSLTRRLRHKNAPRSRNSPPRIA